MIKKVLIKGSSFAFLLKTDENCLEFFKEFKLDK